MSKEWQRFFDWHAPDYMENVFVKGTDIEVEFIIRELDLNTGMRVLDIGCGTGRHSIGLALRGMEVTGLDLSSGMLAQARMNAEKVRANVNWVQADATLFRFDDPFDAAICVCEGSFGLLGVSDDPVEHDLATLRNIFAALKPGGNFLLTALSALKMARQYSDEDVTAGKFDPHRMCESTACEIIEDGEKRSVAAEERGFTPTELKLMCQVAGFDVISVFGGTAGSWNKQVLQLDEYEIMVIAVRGR